MKQFPLHSQHLSLGAHFQNVGDWETPEHYGDSVQEHLAVRKGVGISDLSSRGKIRITGEDRVTWLQSIISNDILPLHPGQGLYSTFMNHKGKILAYFRVLMLEDSIFVEDVGEVNDTTYQQFRKFLLFGTKAKMENCLDRWGILLIAGPNASQLIEKTFGIETFEVKPLEFKSIEIQGHQILMARTEETGELDIELYVPVEGLVSVWEQLLIEGKHLGLQPVGRLALDSLRIEAGIPKLGPDLNEVIVPPEANLEGKAFSLTKGCYPGQEVVARMDTYGAIKRRLVGLVLEKEPSPLPEHGAKIYSGDREVGWISSSAFSPVLNKSLALGFPLRDFSKPDTELTIEFQGQQHRATVHSLPFYSRSSEPSATTPER
jgi:folate-binding protein YgfZ